MIREPNSSRVTSVNEDPSELLGSLGVRLSDILSATRILVLEGPSDEDILEVWFPHILRSPDVAVLSGWGGDGARYADRFADWISEIDKIGLRRVLYLRDRDELAASTLAKLEAMDTVEVLQRRELENYLLDPAAVTKVLNDLNLKGQPAASDDDVAMAIQEAAEDLRRMVIVNRVCQQVHPDQPLMDHRLRQKLAREGADRDAIVTAMTVDLCLLMT